MYYFTIVKYIFGHMMAHLNCVSWAGSCNISKQQLTIWITWANSFVVMSNLLFFYHVTSWNYDLQWALLHDISLSLLDFCSSASKSIQLIPHGKSYDLIFFFFFFYFFLFLFFSFSCFSGFRGWLPLLKVETWNSVWCSWLLHTQNTHCHAQQQHLLHCTIYLSIGLNILTFIFP